MNWHDLVGEEGFKDGFEDDYFVNSHSFYDSSSESVHNIGTSIQELQAFCAHQWPGTKNFMNNHGGISLDCATWNTLSNDNKEKWDLLYPTGKNMSIQGTQLHGAELSDAGHAIKLAVDSQSYNTLNAPNGRASWYNTKNTHGLSINKTDSSKTSDVLESNSHRTKVSQEDVPTSNQEHHEQEYDHALLVNLAKSHLPPSDIWSILSQPVSKTGSRIKDKNGHNKLSVNYTDTYTVNAHDFDDTPMNHNIFWYCMSFFTLFTWIILGLLLFLSAYIVHTANAVSPATYRTNYHVSVHVSKSSHGALVDRGANGGIAGNNSWIIVITDRVVDVTGIANHHIASIKIGTVSAHAKSQRGPVIVIMNQ